MIRLRTTVAAGAGLALLLAGCADDSASDTTTTTSISSEADQPPASGALPERPADGDPVSCTYTPDGQAAKEVTSPSDSDVPAAGIAEVSMTTSAGPIGLLLDRASAPCTVNSFVSLAEQGYFDDTPCHRLVTSPGLQVLQCGDPTGTGTGGPGYGFDTEYPENFYAKGAPQLRQPVVYPRGTIAMANTGQPGSNGSQFFLVYEDSQLPPTYTVFGTVDEAGLAVIEEVAAAGDDGSMSAGGGAPNRPVQIESVSVSS
ncbi:peptidylprolyl isomerase [Rhodococcus sp. HNM0563]|uniref:peptidylprolyl isomerase n=1 Tax=unclassified Rhodococcus (in: high G+C Gram-positive bacteria) TaxID=192944 RepID=UPI001469B2D3|nr:MULTISPECIES: peptidylprolyl isomerase [unclassified Rhodococcus (in: high G+C Gram-positive bacteria)]MCK0092259.1 peptidylprolyl isomerase [Rhodococcus sp. F64268]NLU63475.1 peptidylprolyl isomerase [Rhodococcus sp. HNM0563]